MAALQAKAAGFEGLYLSGAAMTASMGLPDLGIITVDEVAFFVRQYGAFRSSRSGRWRHRLWRSAQRHAYGADVRGRRAGAVHIEDQLLPKKCGHLNDKKLADAQDMAAKVAAAAKARRHLVIRAHRCRCQRRHGRRGRPR